jgi:uncharacterized membrane protein YcaP (DUF421 family)
MESILRGALTYLFIWFVFRLTGRRTLAQITTFDAVLLLIISETAQAALTDDDHSFTNSALLILTILGMDVLLSFVKRKWPLVERWMDGAPLLILNQGVLDRETMQRERVDENDILHAARATQGAHRLDQIEFAVLEPTGEVTVILKNDEK